MKKTNKLTKKQHAVIGRTVPLVREGVNPWETALMLFALLDDEMYQVLENNDLEEDEEADALNEARNDLGNFIASHCK